VIRDAFEKHGVPVLVKSAAIGGTTACGWAKDFGSLAQAAKEQFPELPNGPDFVWYTAGGNDMIDDAGFRSCTSFAPTIEAAEACTDKTTVNVRKCTSTLFENYWHAFPNSKIVQCNYDVPCYNKACNSMDSGYLGQFCRGNINCWNKMALHWIGQYVDKLQDQFPAPRYTGIHIEGTDQMAAGIPGASVGKPNMDRSGPCSELLDCVHPIYGTPAAKAIGEAFWDLYFSKHVGNITNSSSKRASEWVV